MATKKLPQSVQLSGVVYVKDPTDTDKIKSLTEQNKLLRIEVGQLNATNKQLWKKTEKLQDYEINQHLRDKEIELIDKRYEGLCAFRDLPIKVLFDSDLTDNGLLYYEFDEADKRIKARINKKKKGV